MLHTLSACSEGTVTRCLDFEDTRVAEGQLTRPLSLPVAQPPTVACHANASHNNSSHQLASDNSNHPSATSIHDSGSVKEVNSEFIKDSSKLDDSYHSLAIKQPNDSRLSISRISIAEPESPTNSVPLLQPSQMPKKQEAPTPGKSPTMTMNTRYAMKAVQNMFDCSLNFAEPVALTEEQKAFEEQFKLTEKTPTPSQPSFTVFQDPEQEVDENNVQGVLTNSGLSTTRCVVK